MGIFGAASNTPTKINTVPITKSVLGLPTTVAMGRVKIGQSLIWMDGLNNKTAQGGKGTGKGGNAYLYYSDAIAALCEGPISGVNDVWDGQTWMVTPNATENYTIPVSGIIAVTQAASTGVLSDIGVSTAQPYSTPVTDAGSPGLVTLSGSAYAPMTAVAYGPPLTSGTYSFNPLTNSYYFSTAD